MGVLEIRTGVTFKRKGLFFIKHRVLQYITVERGVLNGAERDVTREFITRSRPTTFVHLGGRSIRHLINKINGGNNVPGAR